MQSTLMVVIIGLMVVAILEVTPHKEIMVKHPILLLLIIQEVVIKVLLGTIM